MKKNFSCFLVLSVFLMLASCGVSAKTVKRMQQMEEGVSSPSTIEEYEEAISKYQERILDIDMAQRQVGIWYKIIGRRYLDERMFGKAMEAYQNALMYFPDNQNLYYYVGICASYMSHAAMDFEATGRNDKKQNYLKVAEEAFLRAIKIEPRYVRALYGLGVLYVFEMDESAKAIPHLEKLLEIDTRHTDAMTVLARAYYSNYEFDKAVAMYDKIISITKDAQKKAEAEANKQIVLSYAYGQ